MSTAEELVKAIKERIAAGAEKEAIKEETLEAGHSPEIFEAAYVVAFDSMAATATLPSSFDLFSSGLQFVIKHWQLIFILGTPLAISTMAAIAMERFLDNMAVIILGSVVTVLMLTTYIFFMMASFKLVAQTSEKLDYKLAFAWVRSNLWSFIGLYILTALTIWGGFLLFIIPGVIVSVALYFSLYAFANEGVKGEQALLQSRSLVNGRWWNISFKIGGLILFSFFSVLVILLLSGLVTVPLQVFLSESAVGDVTEVLGQFLSATISIIMVFAGNKLYHALKEQQVVSTKEFSKVWYRVLAGLGLLFFIAILVFIVYLVRMEENLSALMFPGNSEAVRTELFAAGITASAYALTHDNSFAGVCENLKPLVASAETVTCNDTETAWALRVTTGGEGWCSDSTGYNKLSESPLEDRTTCLPI